MEAGALNRLSQEVIGASFHVHAELGPGLLESAYRSCLVYELRRYGLEVQTEVPVPPVYAGVKLGETGYRMDVLVAGELIVEIKALEAIAPVHVAQLVSYLKLANRRLGLC